ncbi:MAG TPA: hypothetical protein VLT33_42885 [Labilithrix sp.]|nr:hypothetical protein [Labilithrix sp.]
MHTRKRTTGSQRVAIVSANPETLDGLQSYLQSAGVAARGTRRLEDCAALTAPATVAVVLFPDEFAHESVVAAVADLGARGPGILRVLVTGHPRTFDAMIEGLRNVLVVPRPVWGWTILDAIRAHVDGDGPRPSPVLRPRHAS